MLSLEPSATESRGIPAAAMECFYGSAIPPFYLQEKMTFIKGSCTALKWKALLDCSALQNAKPRAHSLQFIQVHTSSSTPRFIQLSTLPGPAQTPQPELLFLMFLCSKNHTENKRGPRGQAAMPAHVLASVFTAFFFFCIQLVIMTSRDIMFLLKSFQIRAL